MVRLASNLVTLVVTLLLAVGLTACGGFPTAETVELDASTSPADSGAMATDTGTTTATPADSGVPPVDSCGNHCGPGTVCGNGICLLVTTDSGVAENPDTGVVTMSDSGATQPDAGFVDTGVHPDAAPIDTGVAPDAGVWPDAAPIDTGIPCDGVCGPGTVCFNESNQCIPAPDAGQPVVDAGVWPDAAPIDSGILPDTGVHPDAAPIDTGVVVNPDTGVVTMPDSGVVDTGVNPNPIDAGFVDTGVVVTPDAGFVPPDSGPVDSGVLPPVPAYRPIELVYVATSSVGSAFQANVVSFRFNLVWCSGTDRGMPASGPQGPVVPLTRNATTTVSFGTAAGQEFMVNSTWNCRFGVVAYEMGGAPVLWIPGLITPTQWYHPGRAYARFRDNGQIVRASPVPNGPGNGLDFMVRLP